MSARVGRSVVEFATEVNLSRATIYKLIPEHRPRSIKVGKRRVIIEQPDAWQSRIDSLGGAKTKHYAAKPKAAP